MAQLKNTTINDTGFLQLPVGNTAQRPTPAAGQMRFNTSTGKAEFYNATVAAWLGTPVVGVIATGGTVYDVDVEGTTYRVHVFTSTGNSTFTIIEGGEIEYLIVAAGAAGGAGNVNEGGGGGGAGGLITGLTTVTAQTYTISIGSGSAGTTNTGVNPANGQNSSAFGLTAIGGGAGGSCSPASGGSGGSGGGGGGCSSGKPGGNGTAGQGFAGGRGQWTGDASNPDNGNNGNGGGGGGAGGVGLSGFLRGGFSLGTGTIGGKGIGIVTNIAGSGIMYAQGGDGGAGRASHTGAIAAPNTGNGGGGSANGQLSGAGGSGIVIVRYPLRQENPVQTTAKVVSDGLVLDLDFAKPTVYTGSGTAVTDSRLNGLQGTISGPDYINPRSHRSAFSFDGGSDVITIPAENAIMTTNGSLSFWLYADPTGSSYEGIIDSDFYGLGANGGWRFYRFDSVDIRMWESGNQIVAISNAITENAWQHLALVRDGTAVTIYKNGGQIGTGTSTYAQWDGTLITLGTQYTGASARLNGDLGVVKFYDRALSAAEVLQNFNATRWRFGV